MDQKSIHSCDAANFKTEICNPKFSVRLFFSPHILIYLVYGNCLGLASLHPDGMNMLR